MDAGKERRYARATNLKKLNAAHLKCQRLSIEKKSLVAKFEISDFMKNGYLCTIENKKNQQLKKKISYKKKIFLLKSKEKKMKNFIYSTLVIAIPFTILFGLSLNNYYYAAAILLATIIAGSLFVMWKSKRKTNKEFGFLSTYASTLSLAVTLCIALWSSALNAFEIKATEICLNEAKNNNYMYYSLQIEKSNKKEFSCLLSNRDNGTPEKSIVFKNMKIFEPTYHKI